MADYTLHPRAQNFDPVDKNNLYYGACHVYASDDNGVTWSEFPIHGQSFHEEKFSLKAKDDPNGDDVLTVERTFLDVTVPPGTDLLKFLFFLYDDADKIQDSRTTFKEP